LTLFFVVVLWVVILDMVYVSYRALKGSSILPSSEVGYIRTVLENA
jgi:carbon starvation protein